MAFLKKINNTLNKLSDFFGYLAAILCILMIVVVFYDVMMRYIFNSGSIGMQELEWHLFAAMFLLGTAYTLKENAHVRVDIFYDRMKPKEKAMVNIMGIMFFLIPFCTVIAFGSIDFVSYSFEISEQSPDPGGLPFRYILKAIIPFSYILLLIQGFGEICRNLLTLMDRPVSESPSRQVET